MKPMNKEAYQHTQNLLTTQRMLKKSGKKYAYMVGYDGVQSGECPNDMQDVMYQFSDSLPTMSYLDIILSMYKPLEIRGQYRDMIWVDFYNRGGKIDLPKFMSCGEIVHV